MNTIINASLPVIIEVLEKTSWWRYNLRFGTRTLSTKSQVPLEVGELYYASINTTTGGAININTLQKRPSGAYIEGAEQILESVMQTGDITPAFDAIKTALALCDDASTFELLCQSLLALNSGVLSLPFYYNNLYSLAQIKSFEKGLELYLLFGSFAPLLARIEGGKISEIITPYASFSHALSVVLGTKCAVAKVEPLYKGSKNILDFKG